MMQNALDALNSFGGQHAPEAASNGAENTHAVGGGSSGLGFGVKEALAAPKDHQVYEKVGGKHLVGLYLSVWVRKPLAQHVSAWQVCSLHPEGPNL
jgi:hypothetical protein